MKKGSLPLCFAGNSMICIFPQCTGVNESLNKESVLKKRATASLSLAKLECIAKPVPLRHSVFSIYLSNIESVKMVKPNVCHRFRHFLGKKK